MINGINIILDEPYPEVKILKQNKDIAYKLKQAFSGTVSEMSCINNYIYQYLITPDDFKEIKIAFKKIAIVEMQHLEILGKMIKQLGLLPIYTYINKKDNETYWNSDLINYETDLLSMIKNDIKSEKKAIKQYQEIIKYANDEAISDILNRLILDEQHHIHIFESILNNLI